MKTRIRIYSLKEKGISFSYVSDAGMIVVGGRYDEKNQVGLKHEMASMDYKYIDTLVLPSWKPYFCKPSELRKILEELQPDRIIYPEAIPSDNSEESSLDSINAYCQSEYCISVDEIKDSPNEFFVIDKGDLIVCYIKKGDISVAFYSQCMTEEDKNEITNAFKDKKIDVLISGKDYINDGFSMEIVNLLNPKTAIGRMNPNIKVSDTKILHVGTDDIFISLVNNHIVRLRMVNGFPKLI